MFVSSRELYFGNYRPEAPAPHRRSRVSEPGSSHTEETASNPCPPELWLKKYHLGETALYHDSRVSRLGDYRPEGAASYRNSRVSWLENCDPEKAA